MDKAYQRFICHKCNYRFTMKRGTQVSLRCPYCGGQNVVEDDFDLNTMIREA
jgi:transposase-like protein